MENTEILLKYGKYGKCGKSAKLKGGNVGKDGEAEVAEILINYGNRKGGNDGKN